MTRSKLLLHLCVSVGSWGFQPVQCVNVVYHKAGSLLQVGGFCARCHMMPFRKIINSLYLFWNGLASVLGQVWILFESGLHVCRILPAAAPFSERELGFPLL